jgi:hypothetical protein
VIKDCDNYPCQVVPLILVKALWYKGLVAKVRIASMAATVIKVRDKGSGSSSSGGGGGGGATKVQSSELLNVDFPRRT